MTRVLVCDDSALTREGLRRALTQVSSVSGVSLATSGEEAITRYQAEKPDLVLMDVRMPGMSGLEATRKILVQNPAANVLLMTTAEDVDGVARTVAGGARGYLVKTASREEFIATVGCAIAGAAVRRGVAAARVESTQGAIPTLTEREMQVLEGMSQGQSNSEIGKQLYLSEDTVKTHARRLFRKLGAADRAQAVALGFRWGLVH